MPTNRVFVLFRPFMCPRLYRNVAERGRCRLRRARCRRRFADGRGMPPGAPSRPHGGMHSHSRTLEAAHGHMLLCLAACQSVCATSAARRTTAEGTRNAQLQSCGLFACSRTMLGSLARPVKLVSSRRAAGGRITTSGRRCAFASHFQTYPPGHRTRLVIAHVRLRAQSYQHEALKTNMP